MTHFIPRAVITLLAFSMLILTADAQIFGGLRRDRSNQSRQTRTQRGHTSASQQNATPQSNSSNQSGQSQSADSQPTMANSQDNAHNADRGDNGRDLNGRQHTANRATDLRAPDMGLWFNGSSRDSLVISDVSSRGPIARLCFREGDRIVSVNGQSVAREADFIDYLFGADRDRVEVIVNRDGGDETIWVEPAQFTQDNDHQQVEPIEQFGIVLDNRYDDRIVVWRVIPHSPAYYAGIREGDVISTFDGRPYKTRTEFETSVGDWRTGEAQVQVRRGDRNRDLTVDVPEFNRSTQRDESSDRNDDQSNRDNNRATDNRSNDRANDRNQQNNRQQSNSDQDKGSNRDNSNRNSNDRGGNQMNNNQHGNQPTPNTSGADVERRDSK